MRVPTTDVSVVDLTVCWKENFLWRNYVCIKKSLWNYKWRYFRYTEDLVVSQDFVSDSRTSIIDAAELIEFYFLQNLSHRIWIF
jgi:glyceraldehyde 3-phosphate dehydrogenase